MSAHRRFPSTPAPLFALSRRTRDLDSYRRKTHMKISVIGTGNIGSQVIRSLARAGHEITIANSRGPETLRELADETGATPATAHDAVRSGQVVILSVPFGKISAMRGLFADVPASTIVADMSNYYPIRDQVIEGIDDTRAESEWVSDQIGRRVVKAWNTVFSNTIATHGRPAGDPARIALPVAGDDAQAKKVLMRLVEDTGFDAVDAGSLADSWRLQPGSPVYCTDLQLEDLRAGLARADRSRLVANREAEMRALVELGAGASMDDAVLAYRKVAG
ncbi:NADPH-dependent F420 reductase [Nocardiopsis dassonvillei]|uniref:NADPH-dependent F420 reductase n=1 Tax=Nocardiopsis dassonvillei TaxID=2014 RepID=UPI00366F5BE1